MSINKTVITDQNRTPFMVDSGTELMFAYNNGGTTGVLKIGEDLGGTLDTLRTFQDEVDDINNAITTGTIVYEGDTATVRYQ